MMVKSDLIEALYAENPDLSLANIKKSVDTVFEDMVQALVAGRRVELRGFGAFSVRAYGPRAGRNPKTGITVEVAAKSRAHFKPGKEMRQRLMRSVKPLGSENVD